MSTAASLHSAAGVKRSPTSGRAVPRRAPWLQQGRVRSGQKGPWVRGPPRKPSCPQPAAYWGSQAQSYARTTGLRVQLPDTKRYRSPRPLALIPHLSLSPWTAGSEVISVCPRPSITH